MISFDTFGSLFFFFFKKQERGQKSRDVLWSQTVSRDEVGVDGRVATAHSSSLRSTLISFSPESYFYKLKPAVLKPWTWEQMMLVWLIVFNGALLLIFLPSARVSLWSVPCLSPWFSNFLCPRITEGQANISRHSCIYIHAKSHL